MSSSKYKIGDKVWVQVVIVDVDINGDGYYYVESKSSATRVWVGEGDLSITNSQTTAISVDDVQVGDVVTNQDKFYKVDTVANDRVYVNRNGYSYLMKGDIEAIYRNIYTKKKCVEEMTREELLEYVKQLEGGVNG